MVYMQSTMKRDPLLREVRAGLARHGYTQTDLANHLHTSRAAVSRRMSGEVAFDYRELRTISKFLQVPVSVLYGESAA